MNAKKVKAIRKELKAKNLDKKTNDLMYKEIKKIVKSQNIIR
jgi:hypothetical protein